MIHENFNRVQSYTRLARVFDEDYSPKIHKHSDFTLDGDNKLRNKINMTKNVKRNISYFRTKPIGLKQICPNIIVNENNNILNNFYYKTRSINTNFVNNFKNAIVYNKDIIPNYLKCIQQINTSLNTQSPKNSHKNVLSTIDFGLSNENTTIDYDDNIKTIKFKSFTKSPSTRIKHNKVVQTEINHKNFTLDTEINKTKLKQNSSKETYDNNINHNCQICPKLSVPSNIKEHNEINLEEQKNQLIQSKLKIYESKLLLLFR